MVWSPSKSLVDEYTNLITSLIPFLALYTLHPFLYNLIHILAYQHILLLLLFSRNHLCIKRIQSVYALHFLFLLICFSFELLIKFYVCTVHCTMSVLTRQNPDLSDWEWFFYFCARARNACIKQKLDPIFESRHKFWPGIR